MFKSLKIFTCVLVLCCALPASLLAQSEMVITWTGTPGELESTITADTLSDGTQAHDVYILEANRVYLQRTEVNVNSSFTVRGMEPGDGEFPATIQPLPGDDGLSAFTDIFPVANFQMFGDGAELTLDNLLFNGAFADQSGHLWSIAVPRGADQKVTVENNVWSDYQMTFASFGTNSDFHFNNGIVKACPSYPGGVFFNGFAWGAGSWMGTIDTLIVENSSIMNQWGEAMVVYDQVKYGLVNHNTFANIVMGVCFYRGQNNMTFSNNLFYNIKIFGQSSHFVGLWGGVENGQGIMAVLSQGPADSATIAAGRGWDHTNRNITYNNNAWVNDSNVLDFWQTPPWQWNVESSTGQDSAVFDTMFAIADQYKWVGDSTKVEMDKDPSITEFSNVQTTASLALSDEYIKAIIPRIWDFRDNESMDTYTDEWWQYEHDNDPVNVEWPIHEDLRYDASSPAATASTTGGPVGDPRWMLITTNVDDSPIVPEGFELDQNYPNPFNPETVIRYQIPQAATVQLSIFNVLGQAVRTLVDKDLASGVHEASWDGRDAIGLPVPSGIYYYRIDAGEFQATRKMVLMK